ITTEFDTTLTVKISTNNNVCGVTGKAHVTGLGTMKLIKIASLELTTLWSTPIDKSGPDVTLAECEPPPPPPSGVCNDSSASNYGSLEDCTYGTGGGGGGGNTPPSDPLADPPGSGSTWHCWASYAEVYHEQDGYYWYSWDYIGDECGYGTRIANVPEIAAFRASAQGSGLASTTSSSNGHRRVSVAVVPSIPGNARTAIIRGTNAADDLLLVNLATANIWDVSNLLDDAAQKLGAARSRASLSIRKDGKPSSSPKAALSVARANDVGAFVAAVRNAKPSRQKWFMSIPAAEIQLP
ncbi:MAG: hypothetical protein ABI625_26110, partial [bacterium]